MIKALGKIPKWQRNVKMCGAMTEPCSVREALHNYRQPNIAWRLESVQHWLCFFTYASAPSSLFVCASLFNSVCVSPSSCSLDSAPFLPLSLTPCVWLCIFCLLGWHLVAQGYLLQLIRKVNCTAQAAVAPWLFAHIWENITHLHGAGLKFHTFWVTTPQFQLPCSAV